MCKALPRLLLFLTVAALFVTACQSIQPPTLTPLAQVVAPDSPLAMNTPAPTPDPSAAQRLLQEGIQSFDDEDYDKAVASFTEAIRLDPDLAEAYIKRAATYLRIREFKAAIPDCDAAIRLNPNNADAYLYRGIAYAYTDDFDAAISDLTEAIRLDPQSVDAHVYRGVAYFVVERYPASVQDCTDALHLSGGYFLPVELCLNVMGMLVAADFEDADAALQDYELAIRQNPEFAGAYLIRGLTLRNRGEIEAAIKDLEEALRLDPSLADPLLMYWSQVYMNPEDPAKAIAELETALALVEPDSVLAVIIAAPLDQLAQHGEQE